MAALISRRFSALDRKDAEKVFQARFIQVDSFLNRSTMRVSSYLLAVFFSFTLLSAVAQNDFADLSPRERVAVAEQEEIEAKNDEVFQQLMREGHELFREKHYLKAIRRYEEAKKRRPYNVYPPVIITDIELSMKDTLDILRERERQELESKTKAQPQKPQQPQPPAPEPKPENEWTETKQERIEKINNWERQERIKLEQSREQKKEQSAESLSPENPEIRVLTMEDMQEQLAREFPEGITENTYTEGNKTITERVVVKNGKGNRYKKVVHSWGGVFYFKNGTAVAERVWTAETK